MDDQTPSRTLPAIRVRGRSFMALVLTPDPALPAWLDALDAEIARAGSFFAARPVVLDLGLLHAETASLDRLGDALAERGLRVVATDNWSDGATPPGLPAPLGGGRAAAAETVPDGPAEPVAPDAGADGEGAAADATAPARRSLVLDEPVRSGTQILFPDGDVTVLGSVASGAEVLAGGTVHVYGALRGRAIAGFGGRPDARVICRRLEAELIAIDGFYLTADDMDAAVLGRPAQALLADGRIAVRALD